MLDHPVRMTPGEREVACRKLLGATQLPGDRGPALRRRGLQQGGEQGVCPAAAPWKTGKPDSMRSSRAVRRLSAQDSAAMPCKWTSVSHDDTHNRHQRARTLLYPYRPWEQQCQARDRGGARTWLRDEGAACSTSVRRLGVESRRARPVQRPPPIMEAAFLLTRVLTVLPGGLHDFGEDVGGLGELVADHVGVYPQGDRRQRR